MRGMARLLAFVIGGGALAACQPETPACVQNIGIDITNVVVDSYNGVIIGSPNGSGSWTFNCSMGGSAAITGTVNTSTVSFELDYTFTNCHHDSDLTLSGSMHDSTVNGGNSDTKIELVTSPALTLRGTEIGCDADPIDATCEVRISYSGSSSTATICGLDYP